mmetsp:Transcript_21207/g.54304  ORF Transcript_21207/g.54304 Transcript_21207/m.54304 type:complete len:218 (+) Transcript_21207:506-1159(+)
MGWKPARPPSSAPPKPSSAPAVYGLLSSARPSASAISYAEPTCCLGEPRTEPTPSESDMCRRPDALPNGRALSLLLSEAPVDLVCISCDSLPIFLPAAPRASLGEPRALREPFWPSTYSISRCLRCALCTDELPADISPDCHCAWSMLPWTSAILVVCSPSFSGKMRLEAKPCSCGTIFFDSERTSSSLVTDDLPAAPSCSASMSASVKVRGSRSLP